jgi:hypothetical protein
MRIAASLALVLVAGCIETHDGDAGGSGGSAGSAGSAGFSAECRQERDPNPFAFSVTDPNGFTEWGASDDLMLRGTVKSVENASFSVEGCGTVESASLNVGGAGGEGGVGGAPGGAGGGTADDCGSWTVEIVAPELVIPVKTGMNVSVAHGRNCQPYSGCNVDLVVRDELADGESLLLAIHAASFGGRTGAVSTRLEWPVGLELADLGCGFPETPYPDPITWALRMASHENPASSLLLHMGESGELSLDSASEDRWLARNVNSFDVGGYDATTALHFYLAKRL